MKDLFDKNTQYEKYEETLNFLKLANMLDFQLTQKKITVKLLDDNDVKLLLSYFFKTLTTNNYNQNKLVFENIVQLLSLREVKKSEIQNILYLPWLDASVLQPNITKIHLANAKSLDFLTKVKCLNSISRFGSGRHRLDILSMCLYNCEVELGVATIL